MIRIKSKKAFTLLEMSIVILIIGILIVGTINFQITIDTKSRENITADRINRIEKAISEYFLKNGKLPCPSNIEAKKTDLNYGVEYRFDNVCSGYNEKFVSNDLIYGGVPTKALELTDEYGVDGWNNTINYVISKKFGDKKMYLTDNEKMIKVQNLKDKEITNNAIYILISTGKNKNGAFRDGKQRNTDTSLKDSPNTFSNNFTDTFKKDIRTDNFDDIVSFKEKDLFIIKEDLETLPCTLKDLRDLDSNWNYDSYAKCNIDGICPQGTIVPSKNDCENNTISKNPSNVETKTKPLRKCLNYGQWSNIIYPCINSCGESNIDSITTNMILSSGILGYSINRNFLKRGKIGEVIELQCLGDKVGYIKLECGDDGNWSYKSGDCYDKEKTPVFCENSQLNSNDKNMVFSTTTGTTESPRGVEGECATGYAQVEDKDIVAICQRSGTWFYTDACSLASGSIIFNYTGSQQTWTVPEGVTSIKIQVWGAQGGSSYGGYGGYSYGTLSVSSGSTVYIYVGGQGLSGSNGTKAGGWNGGGNGWCEDKSDSYVGGGGGSSDVRYGGTSTSDRKIVAGGGGGGGYNTYYGGAGGGFGGGGSSNGGTGAAWDSGCGGRGGTSSSVGTPSCGCGNSGSGMTGGSTSCKNDAGGGGGYYGGASGGGNGDAPAGGGGGSGYIGGVTNGGGSSGVRLGNGVVRICWGSNTDCELDDMSGNVKNCNRTQLNFANATFANKTGKVEHGSVENGICNTGYYGSVIATCQSDGTWDYTGSCEITCDLNDLRSDPSDNHNEVVAISEKAPGVPGSKFRENFFLKDYNFTSNIKSGEVYDKRYFTSGTVLDATCYNDDTHGHYTEVSLNGQITISEFGGLHAYKCVNGEWKRGGNCIDNCLNVNLNYEHMTFDVGNETTTKYNNIRVGTYVEGYSGPLIVAVCKNDTSWEYVVVCDVNDLRGEGENVAISDKSPGVPGSKFRQNYNSSHTKGTVYNNRYFTNEAMMDATCYNDDEHGHYTEIKSDEGPQLTNGFRPHAYICENGEWKRAGTCSLNGCYNSDLDLSLNAVFTTTGTTEYNETQIGTCNSGYNGTITATCQVDGTWSYSGICSNENVCDKNDLDLATNSYLSPSNEDSQPLSGTLYANGALLDANCNSGYVESADNGDIQGTWKSHAYKCVDGQWKTMGSCAPVNCSSEQIIQEMENNHMVLECVNNSCWFVKCNTGYSQVGNWVGYSCSNGNWVKSGSIQCTIDNNFCDINDIYAKLGETMNLTLNGTQYVINGSMYNNSSYANGTMIDAYCNDPYNYTEMETGGEIPNEWSEYLLSFKCVNGEWKRMGSCAEN